MIGLYVHIPFCAHICAYCDFPKRIPKNALMIDQYLLRLRSEWEEKKQSVQMLDTIYIGGGTPSYLNLEQLKVLLEMFVQYHVTEYTFEMNPEDVTLEKAKLLKKYGVNRISLGIQTMHQPTLKLLNRQHTPADVHSAIEVLHSAGFDNISTDFIFGLPGETIEHINQNLAFIQQLDIKHISYYSLILEEKTVFKHLVNKGALTLCDNDLVADFYERIINVLCDIGYEHYEISNFAKPGFESKHNMLYWTSQSWIGIGAGASGFINGIRSKNHNLVSKYMNHVLDDEIVLSLDDLMNEMMLLGLRLLGGVNRSIFIKRFNQDPLLKFPFLVDLEKKGLIVITDDAIALTKKGVFFGNQVFSYFV